MSPEKNEPILKVPENQEGVGRTIRKSRLWIALALAMGLSAPPVASQESQPTENCRVVSYNPDDTEVANRDQICQMSGEVLLEWFPRLPKEMLALDRQIGELQWMVEALKNYGLEKKGSSSQPAEIYFGRAEPLTRLPEDYLMLMRGFDPAKFELLKSKVYIGYEPARGLSENKIGAYLGRARIDKAGNTFLSKEGKAHFVTLMGEWLDPWVAHYQRPILGRQAPLIEVKTLIHEVFGHAFIAEQGGVEARYDYDGTLAAYCDLVPGKIAEELYTAYEGDRFMHWLANEGGEGMEWIPYFRGRGVQISPSKIFTEALESGDWTFYRTNIVETYMAAHGMSYLAEKSQCQPWRENYLRALDRLADLITVDPPALPPKPIS